MFSFRQAFRMAAGGIPLAVGAVLSPAGAVAPEGTSAVCTFEAHEVTTEGDNWITPGSARNETVPAGQVTCVGTVAGQPVAPRRGSISYWYLGGTQLPATATGGEACQAWGGHGEMNLTLPMAEGGQISMVGGFTARGSGATGVVLGHFGTARLVMAVQLRPEPGHLDENCVSKPFNHFITTGQGKLTG